MSISFLTSVTSACSFSLFFLFLEEKPAVFASFRSWHCLSVKGADFNFVSTYQYSNKSYLVYQHRSTLDCGYERRNDLSEIEFELKRAVILTGF